MKLLINPNSGLIDFDLYHDYSFYRNNTTTCYLSAADTENLP